MGFKHTDFYSSETMRSLEKLAKDKGLIKEESLLTKIASSPAKKDLKPTNNLMENLLKLCSGLRTAGFDKYAEDLESTFVMYKQAASQCECDVDIIEKAHPKGSYKLDGVDGDAIIETIIDQHLKDMQIVNKKPIGKLATSNNIIDQVKKSLGQDGLIKKAEPSDAQKTRYNEIIEQVSENLNHIASILANASDSEIIPFATESPAGLSRNLERYIVFLNGIVKNQIMVGNNTKLAVLLGLLKSLHENSAVFKTEFSDKNIAVKGGLNQAIRRLEDLSWSVTHPDYMPAAEAPKPIQTTPALVQPKPAQNPNIMLQATVPEISGMLRSHAAAIQHNILNKEKELYAPLQETEIDKINLYDRAFDRIENLYNQLNALAATIDSYGYIYEGKKRINQDQLHKSTIQYTMFNKQYFTSLTELSTYIKQIISTVIKALGIKDYNE